MARRKENALPKNDFAAEENLDVCGFSSEPIVTGECISSFSFDDDSVNETKSSVTVNTENKSNVNTFSNITDDKSNNATISNNQITLNKNNVLEDNRKSPVINGIAPPINGEYLDVKRTYMLRASTVRKVNELKSIHPELNTYVSTIVDLAIARYYEYIINGGSQQ